MATRLRKTRRLRGGRHMGWGQVAQHRASGHKGGLGVTGFQKHHYSSLLKDEPDHYGHESSSPPHPNITKKWASVRDLDDLFAKFGKQQENKKILDLNILGFDKLLGGGQIKNAYTIKIERSTAKAQEKVKQSGGEIIMSAQKTIEKTEKKALTNNDG